MTGADPLHEHDRLGDREVDPAPATLPRRRVGGGWTPVLDGAPPGHREDGRPAGTRSRVIAFLVVSSLFIGGAAFASTGGFRLLLDDVPDSAPLAPGSAPSGGSSSLGTGVAGDGGADAGSKEGPSRPKGGNGPKGGGSTGSKGHTGQEGNTGSKGHTGKEGNTGSKGRTGKEGNTGSRGGPENDGPTGSTGKPGP